MAMTLMLISTATMAFSQAMPESPAIPQGAITSRAAQAQRLTPVQNLGDALPLHATFTDAAHHPVQLGSYFNDGRPVVMVLGYYRCPNLCGTVMQGVLEALAATGLPRDAWRIVYVSVDPTETPEMAVGQGRVWAQYAEFVDKNKNKGSPQPLDLNPLVGDEATTTALAHTIGFTVEPDASAANARPATDHTLSRYAHPAEFFIATPQGRISQYLMGVRFDAQDLRLALVAASQGSIGTLADRLVLLCSHFDPATGRYNGAVMGVMRGVGIASVLILVLWGWRHRRTPAAKPTHEPA
jgi:protein SCO1/2